MGKVFTGAKQLLGEELFRDHHVLAVAFCCSRSSLKCTDDQVILTGMFTVIKGDIQCKIFAGHSKITRAINDLTGDCSSRLCLCHQFVGKKLQM